jgi:hypothetical protein
MGNLDAVVWLKEEYGLEFPAHQQEVLQSEAARLMICDDRRTGKTMLLAGLALWHAYHHPGSVILCAHPSLGAMEFFDILNLLVGRNRRFKLSSRWALGLNYRLSFANGSSIRSLLFTPSGAYMEIMPDYRTDALLIDEADCLHPRQAAFLLSRLLHFRRVAVASTPNPDAQDSFFKAWCRDRNSGWYLAYYPFLLCPLHSEGQPCAYTLQKRRNDLCPQQDRYATLGS